MIIQSLGSGCEKSQSPCEMLHFALVISCTNCFTFFAAANCCSSIKCAGKTKCPNLGTCAPITFYRWVCQSTSTTKGSTKLRTPKSSCKGNCRPHWVYVSLTVCASWMLKWNMDTTWKHHRKSSLSFLLPEFHKDILAVQGHHQLKTYYFCIDVRMPLWQIHKWYSDTARGQREVKDTPWWFHVPLPHKKRSFPFLIYNLDKLMWSTVPKTTEIL